MKNKYLISLCFTLTSALIFHNALASVNTKGAPSCGKWIEERDISKAKSDTTWTSLVHKAWLMGFLSGIAIGSDRDLVPENRDPASLFLWVDNYCRANPLKSVNDAGFNLAVELATKR